MKSMGKCAAGPGGYRPVRAARGTVVRVTAELGDWAEIVIADGKKGWIETRKVEVI